MPFHSEPSLRQHNMTATEKVAFSTPSGLNEHDSHESCRIDLNSLQGHLSPLHLTSEDDPVPLNATSMQDDLTPLDLNSTQEDQSLFLDFSFFPVEEATVSDNEDNLFPNLDLDIDLDVDKDLRDALDAFPSNDSDPSKNSMQLPSLFGTSESNCESSSAESSSPNVHSTTSYVADSPQSAEAVVMPDDQAQDEPRIMQFQEEMWDGRYKELLDFVKEKGHAGVPHTYPRNQKLARWVKRQRRQYKLFLDGNASTMNRERVDLLNSAGFVWDSHDINWREKLDLLEEYRQRNGHCNVPTKYVDKKLAIWVKCQRRQYKLYMAGKPSAMTPSRMMLLEEKGFEWEIRSNVPKRAAPKKIKTIRPDLCLSKEITHPELGDSLINEVCINPAA